MAFEPWFSWVKVVPSGAKEPLKMGMEPLPLSSSRISGAQRGAPRQDSKPLGEIKDKNEPPATCARGRAAQSLGKAQVSMFVGLRLDKQFDD